MKQVFGTWCAMLALLLVGGVGHSVSAQVSSATPDPFAVQLTSSPSTAFFNFTGDTSADGRFVVVVSNGDIATEKTATRNNADGNYEIFLIDYAQRRTFQITDTRSVPIPAASPSPTPTPSPTPSPSPTPTPVPVPENPFQLKVHIQSGGTGHLCQISLQPKLDSNGKRTYVIVFSSNAPAPKSFDGTDSAALDADANSEIWIYAVPAVADVDLTSGADVPFTDLSAGTFTQITNTTASRAPVAGDPTNLIFPFFADDNREATISDDGNRIAFVSTRNLVGTGNSEANPNPEIFLFDRQTGSFAQLTNTLNPVFNSNPNLSSDGSVVAFISNGNLAATSTNNDNGDGTGNEEIYVANYTGTTFTGLRQVTKTKTGATHATVNLFQPGRRLSRDGSMLAFDSLADDPKANDASTNKPFNALFVYTLASDTFTLVGTRATGSTDIFNYPTFTDYDGSLKPSTLVFASALNFKTDGTFPTTATDGLNPLNNSQIFSYPLPANASNTFTRLTNNPTGSSFGGLRPITSSSRKRIAFSMGGVELGGGNVDSSTEVYYLLTPTVLADSSAPLLFFAGASAFGPVPAPSPSASPTPTPSPSPSPGTALGLSAGEITLIRSTSDLALPTNAGPFAGSETRRTPALPTELNGVSVSVNGGAAGLYFVGKSPQQINFVMPIGLPPTGTGNVVVNNNGTVTRGQVPIITGQPDVFTTTMDAGGNAFVFDVTNPNNRIDKTGKPISVTSDDGTGTQVPTVLEIDLTGVRGLSTAQITVTIGTTSITTVNFVGSNPEMPGLDLVKITLPDTLKGAGDVPLIVTSTASAATSRPADTAPHVNIGP